MAKLRTYYGLCPLIDQRNLLGVAEDAESGHVIVTLGKNIAVKYRLSDQKQIHSWRTKDKFSSPVIYDKLNNQYVAVFNQTYIRIWKGNEEYLDKLKKLKFGKTIYTLINCNNIPFIIFKNGAIIPLGYAIENCKNLNINSVITNGESDLEILSANLKDEIYVGILLKSKVKTMFVWKTFSKNKTSEHKIELVRENSELTLRGQILTQIEYQHNIHLLTLWSDGKLYSYPLNTCEDNTHNEVGLSGSVFAVVESLSCKHPVTMAFLNQHYIAMYGADANEEGATLILYNTQFKVSQSKQPLKLFTSGAKLWKIGNNLLVCIGQNLAVIPYHLATEQLAALVGSHRTAVNDLDPDITIIEEIEVVNWHPTEILENAKIKSVPNKIKEKVLELTKQGLSERTICEQLLPEYMQKKNVQSIFSCLKYFRDIPELYMAKLLQFCFTVETKHFKNMQSINSKSLPAELQPLERCILLDTILMLSFSDILLLPHIRSELDLNTALLLLQYINYLMSDDGHCLPSFDSTEFNNKLIEWGCILIDANYQRFILTKDARVLEMLLNYNKLVEEHLTCLENLNQLVPMLIEFKKGKRLSKNNGVGNLTYSVEKLSLY